MGNAQVPMTSKETFKGKGKMSAPEPKQKPSSYILPVSIYMSLTTIVVQFLQTMI